VFADLYKKKIFVGETTAAKEATHWQRYCGNYIPGIHHVFLGIFFSVFRVPRWNS
jgi:hypothetical protein